MRSPKLFRAVATASVLIGAGPVMSGAVQAATKTGNLLKDPSFEQKSVKSGYTTFTGKGGSPAAAKRWEAFNNTQATTTTDLLPTTLPAGLRPGKRMIHVVTTGANNGLDQQFGKVGKGPAQASFSVRVYVVQGSVGAGIGNGGNTSLTASDSKPGKWVNLHGSSGGTQTPVNNFIIYAKSAGVNDFYVDLAFVARPIKVCCVPPVK
jgi:hypothetical protein